MDLRAGVLSHAVIQHKVREKRNPDDVGIGGNIYYFDSFVKLIFSYWWDWIRNYWWIMYLIINLLIIIENGKNSFARMNRE